MVQVITDQNRMNDAAMHKLGAFINPFSGWNCGQAALWSSLGLKIVLPPLDHKLCHATDQFSLLHYIPCSTIVKIWEWITVVRMDPESRFVPISSVSPRAHFTQKICVPHFFLDILLEDPTRCVLPFPPKQWRHNLDQMPVLWVRASKPS